MNIGCISVWPRPPFNEPKNPINMLFWNKEYIFSEYLSLEVFAYYRSKSIYRIWFFLNFFCFHDSYIFLILYAKHLHMIQHPFTNCFHHVFSWALMIEFHNLWLDFYIWTSFFIFVTYQHSYYICLGSRTRGRTFPLIF